MKFNQKLIMKNIQPHFKELNRIVHQAHSYFIQQASITGANYDGVAYAWIMQKNIIDLLSKSYIITKGIGKLVSHYNIFLLEIAGYLISFNKVNFKKQKSKDIEIQNGVFDYSNSLKQLSLFSADNENNIVEVTNVAPLTVGYIVKNAGILGTYLTHQIGKTVHWYENMSEFDPKTVYFKPTTSSQNNVSNTRKVRIKNKNRNNDKVVHLKNIADDTI